MKTEWIIIKSVSDDEEIELYRFYGSSDEVKEKLLFMAQNGDKFRYAEIDEEEMPKSVDDVEYDFETETYQILVQDAYGESEERYSAKRVEDICEFSEEVYGGEPLCLGESEN